MELLLKIVGLFENFHEKLEDPSKFLVFFVDFFERIGEEKELWEILQVDKALIHVLQITQNNLVITKIVECLSLILLSNNENHIFDCFAEQILINFQRNDLKVINTIIKKVMFF